MLSEQQAIVARIYCFAQIDSQMSAIYLLPPVKEQSTAVIHSHLAPAHHCERFHIHHRYSAVHLHPPSRTSPDEQFANSRGMHDKDQNPNSLSPC